MISTTFVLFLILTLYQKFSRKLFPLVSSLTYCQTLYLRHSNQPIAFQIPLLIIHNDLILATERGEVTSLIHLHLSAAFDTINHSILLHRLRNWFGLHGTSLDWFPSYLTSRSQAVSIQNSTSFFTNLSCAVPQGSVLDPLLYILYTIPFGSVISKNSTNLYHLYVDDTQLYISVTPSNSTSLLGILSNTFSCILSWMNANKLLLNPPNTEFLLVGTKQQRLKFYQLKLAIISSQ